jgi:GNAT superfamily N-acetyltransferase
MVDFYASRGIEPRVELSPYADDALVRQLADAGFVVRVYENILFRPLGGPERIEAPRAAPPGLRIGVIDPGDAGLVREAARVVALGFTPPGQEVREEDLDVWSRCAAHPRTTLLGAFLDGALVGAGSLEISGEIATLFGLSVLEGFRRRGIQQALIAERLRRAAASGASVATIGARPLVPTERNVRRMGFQIAYTKTILVRPGAGLAPVVG